MEKLKVVMMYNELHNADMWYVESDNGSDKEPDYYSPYHHKASAENTKKNCLV